MPVDIQGMTKHLSSPSFHFVSLIWRWKNWQPRFPMNTVKSQEKSVFPPTTGVGEDAGKKEPFYTVGGNVD
jgi:hypothetical protein